MRAGLDALPIIMRRHEDDIVSFVVRSRESTLSRAEASSRSSGRNTGPTAALQGGGTSWRASAVVVPGRSRSLLGAGTPGAPASRDPHAVFIGRRITKERIAQGCASASTIARDAAARCESAPLSQPLPGCLAMF